MLAIYKVAEIMENKMFKNLACSIEKHCISILFWWKYRSQWVNGKHAEKYA